MSEKIVEIRTEGFVNEVVDIPEKLHALSPTDSLTNVSTAGKVTEPNVHNLHAAGPFVYPANASTAAGKHEWRGTWLRFGPLSGIFAFGGVMLSTIASLGILVGSNDSDVNSWPTPPSTYIAIFTAIGNIMMRYAAVQGILIAWWLKALHGSSIGELHYSWRAGASFHGAIMAGNHMGWIGLASILSCLVIVLDGPLFQRSSTVSTGAQTSSAVELHFTMVPELPTDYTGGWIPAEGGAHSDNAFNSTMPSPNGSISNTIIAGAQGQFGPILPLWATDKPLPGSVSGCPGQCTGKMIAPALAATSCNRSKSAVDYTAPWSFASGLEAQSAPPLDHQSFIVATVLDVSGDRERINSITAYAPTQDCVGELEITVCSLESAVAEYQIFVEDHKMTLENAASPRIIGIANNTAVNRIAGSSGYRPSTLAGVVAGVHLTWDSYLTTTVANGSANPFANRAGGGGNIFYLFAGDNSGIGGCPAFRDPREAYTASLNRLMVFSGLYAAQGIANPRLDTLDPSHEINATTTGELISSHSVYDTNYWFFLAAALVEVICISLIAPTYWGWWKIGRDVSFSPLEIARAFGAPILDHVNSNSTGLEIARSCNDQRVQYGRISAVNNNNNKLEFSQPGAVSWPRRGSIIEV